MNSFYFGFIVGSGSMMAVLVLIFFVSSWIGELWERYHANK